MIEVRYRVDLIESERGWGSKIDETRYFDDLKVAEDFVTDFNSQNDKNYVPDWYMYATEPVMEPVK
jgi:hypothetical protein